MSGIHVPAPGCRVRCSSEARPWRSRHAVKFPVEASEENREKGARRRDAGCPVSTAARLIAAQPIGPGFDLTGKSHDVVRLMWSTKTLRLDGLARWNANPAASLSFTSSRVA